MKLFANAATIILFNIIQISLSQSLQQFSSIYSSTYSNKVDTHDRINQIQFIEVASKKGFVFATAEVEGLIILDSNNDNKLIFQGKLSGPLYQAIAVTSDGQHVFLSINNTFCVYQFLYSNNSYGLYQYYQNKTDVSQIQRIQVLENENRVIIAHFSGLLTLVDISKRDNQIISILANYTVQSTLRGLKITKDMLWIILSDYNYGLMVFYWQDQTNAQKTLNLINVAISPSVSPSYFVITQDGRYVMIVEYWDGFSIIDLYPIQQKYIQNQFTNFTVDTPPLVVRRWWIDHNSAPNSLAITMTNNENYVMVGQRSVGIYIIDISNKLNPKLFQIISAPLDSLSLILSKDSQQQYLYYSNGNSLLAFKKSEPNLNLDVPNILNVQKSTSVNAGNSRWRWTGAVDINNQFLFQSSQDQGLAIMDLRVSPQLMTPAYQIPVNISGGSVDSFFLFGKSHIYLAVPIQTLTTMMNIYNITDRTNPILIQSIPSDDPSYSYSMDMSDDETLFVFDNHFSFVLFNSTTIGKFTQISQWQFQNGIFGGIANGLIISHDSNYIVAVERASVICVVDISNKKNPQLASFSRTNGGENIIKAKYGSNKQYAFIVQGLYGIDVIDMNSLPELNIVSRVQIQGYSNFISLIQNNTYALVSQLDIGEISLVNYTDITQPKIISTFQYVNEHAASVCTSPFDDFFYILSQNGLRTVPLKSNTYIHTEIQQVLNANTGSPQLIHLSKYQSLLVGQQINYQFQILLPTPGIQITNVYYIQYGQLQSLPYWMNYNPIQQTLSLNIVKGSLGQNYDTSKLNQLIQNTIVVQSNIPVLASDLVFTKDVHGVDQSLDQANQILNYFHNIGLLDKSDFVTSVFQYQKPLGINLNGINFSDQLLNNIKLVLQNSVTLNPIFFNTQSSLNINLNPPQNQGYQLLYYISALQSRVYMFLTIDLQYGMFVNKNYNGLISSTTSARNQLRLEGDPQVLNACLNNKIEVFIYGIQNTNFTSKKEELLQLVNITVQLQDNTNYDIIQNFTINQASFFQIRDRLVLNPNPNMNLQNQVNSQFSDGNLQIKTSISIEFSQSSFIIVDSQTDQSLPLTYNAYLIKNGQYISIPSNFWLQFQPSLLKFTGQCSYSEFNNKYCFFLNVTDQYSVASDTFCVVTNQIPFLTILNLVFQILGPIVFVLGLYKYQNIFYNWIFAQKNLYSTEYAKINHTFYHRTIFIGQNMQIANEIFTKFINEFNQGRITISENPIPEDQTNVNDMEHSQIQDKAKEMAKKNISQELNLSRDFQKKITDLAKTPNQKQTKIEQTYLSQRDLSLLFEKFIADLLKNHISFIFDGEVQLVTSYKEYIESKSNLLRLSIRSLLARHLLEKDKITMKAYNFLKQYSKDQKKYTKNDWYKHYVHIKHMEEDEDNDEANLSILPMARIAASPSNLNQNFNNNININQQNKSYNCNIPQLSIKKESFDLALNTFNIEEEEENTAQEAYQQEIPVRNKKTSISIKVIQKQTRSKLFSMINRHLLKEILFADTLGLVNPSPPRYRPCSGESIHLEEHEIASVRAFTKANKSYLSGLRRIFKLEYVPLASYENRKLPQWLDYTSKQDLFLLKGCPTIEDQSEILLRFYNQKQFILKQFLIKIEQDKTEDSQLNRIVLQKQLNSSQNNTQNQLRYRNTKQYSENNQDQHPVVFTPIQLKSILNSNQNFFQGNQKLTIQATTFNQNENNFGESQSNADDEIISMEGEDIQENTLKEYTLKSNYQIQSQEIILGQKNAPRTNQDQQQERQDNKINKYRFDVLNIKSNSQNEQQNE